jgi:hypothetical protein
MAAVAMAGLAATPEPVATEVMVPTVMSSARRVVTRAMAVIPGLRAAAVLVAQAAQAVPVEALAPMAQMAVMAQLVTAAMVAMAIRPRG